MIIRIIPIMMALLFLTPSASAEIYKYRDTNGVLRFTDNLAEVPVDQRGNIEAYQEIKTTEPAAEPNATEAAPQDPQAVGKALLEEKTALDTEYNRLTDLRSRLEAEPIPGTDEAMADYEKRVQDYQAQLEAYEEQRKAFREKVKTYEDAAAQSEQR